MRISRSFLVNTAMVLLLAGGVTSLLMLSSSKGETAGTDELAERDIRSLHGSYRQWARPLWRAPGPEAETLLFSLQSGLGGLALGYALGRLKGTRSR